MTNVLLGKTLPELQEVALSVGLPKFAGKQLAEWLYVRQVRSFDEMTKCTGPRSRQHRWHPQIPLRSLSVRRTV